MPVVPFGRVRPPIEPMLARLADAIPAGAFLYEPKWDGFRALVFRDGVHLYVQSRDLRPLDRYFPELHAALLDRLPRRCVVDGEIVIATPHGLDFDALQMRLHPAESRIRKLAAATPASFVAFDLLSLDLKDLRARSFADRRAALERALRDAQPPLYLTPSTRDLRTARRWLDRFEGAGLDGVVAKPADVRYEPGKRVLVKIKHARTADCVVAGFRWYRARPGLVGSLLLGLYDDNGRLHHVGVTSSFTLAMREQLAAELEPLRKNALAQHPWRSWGGLDEESGDVNMPGGPSRWSAGKDMSWEPLRPERVCEVKYDHLQGRRFRHATIFLRWRPDKSPASCRYDQLEVTAPYELSRILRRA
ncbi:MAG TPA: ATP-dependent DNA ligase [Vicinamibacterales bacterium]|nr:ATP-dependent DNA ligase [Vicinamibacterales bacterium]